MTAAPPGAIRADLSTTPLFALPTSHEPLVRAALRLLGVRKLVLGIHDPAFPSDPGEDTGHGSPHTRAAARLLGFARRLGFTGVQLGPQGQITAHNPSPYDSTLFTRNVGAIALHAESTRELLAGLAGEAAVRAAVAPSAGEGRCDYERALPAIERLLDQSFAALKAKDPAPLLRRFNEFRAAQSHWLPGAAPAANAANAASASLAAERFAFGQWVAHEQHAGLRATAGALPLALYGDLQVGMSDRDAHTYQALFLRDYVMGAPPSRTNPQGQPWGYPVLDPHQLGTPAAPGPALRFLLARVDKAFDEYDGLRIDHPHGLVCPWVYRRDSLDPLHAVAAGARLYGTPASPAHPELARHAIDRPEQINPDVAPWAEGWETSLDPAQIARYSLLFDAIVAASVSRGRDPHDLVCEVLSTLPFPLGEVLKRHGLGRFRVLQKANLSDPGDVYRSENARPRDWVMLGNHDTPPVGRVLRAFTPAVRAQWARHLGERLSLAPATLARLPNDNALLASAMLAELLACPAEHVMIYFTDLFGIEEIYNAPGTVHAGNWSLRLPPHFERLYATRLAAGAALNLPLALSLALAAHPDLAAAQRDLIASLREAASHLSAQARAASAA